MITSETTPNVNKQLEQAINDAKHLNKQLEEINMMLSKLLKDLTKND